MALMCEHDFQILRVKANDTGTEVVTKCEKCGNEDVDFKQGLPFEIVLHFPDGTVCTLTSKET